MNYVFIGDVHGKVEAVREALAKPGKKIFVGDIIDSYDKTVSEHRECYRLILDAIKAGESECLFGNHELSYLMPTVHRCSGWDQWRDALMRELSSELHTYFKPYILLRPDFLVSHAGLTNQLWKSFNCSVETLESKLQTWWDNQRSPAHFIGQIRGGFRDVGGLFWCDWNHEFQPVSGLTQVFGHTGGHGIRQVENSFCIDCLDHKPFLFLEMEIK